MSRKPSGRGLKSLSLWAGPAVLLLLQEKLLLFTVRQVWGAGLARIFLPMGGGVRRKMGPGVEKWCDRLSATAAPH